MKDLTKYAPVLKRIDCFLMDMKSHKCRGVLEINHYSDTIRMAENDKKTVEGLIDRYIDENRIRAKVEKHSNFLMHRIQAVRGTSAFALRKQKDKTNATFILSQRSRNADYDRDVLKSIEEKYNGKEE